MADTPASIALSLFGPETQETIARQNPWYQAKSIPDLTTKTVADIVGSQATKDPDRYSLGEIAAVQGIGGLLSALLGRQGAAYQPVLTERYQNVATGKPAGGYLPSGLFNSARERRKIFEEAKVQQAMQDLRNLRLKGQESYIGAMGGELGTLAAYEDGMGENKLLGPKNEAKRNLEKQARSELVKTAGNFDDLKANFLTMRNVYKQNTRPASLTFIQSLARVMDPGSVVRGEEILRAEKAQSLVEQMGYSWSSVITGKQNISPLDKLKMINAAGEKYNAVGNEILNVTARQKKMVANLGGDPENVFAPLSFEPFSFRDFLKSEKVKQETFEQELERLGVNQDELLNGDSLKSQLQNILEKKKANKPLTGEDLRILQKARELKNANN